MTIIEKIIRSTDIGSEYDSYGRDTLTLAWQDRRQGHGRRQSDGGLLFAISLPNSTVLKPVSTIMSGLSTISGINLFTSSKL